ncbi:MAG: hypothetical protein CBD16_08380 [Betaproteobacteria bacterium TMED156]|nr:MAG: hypothetical protein CBD16_08380 [Betaproteobacteria bacterium TMED156]
MTEDNIYTPQNIDVKNRIIDDIVNQRYNKSPYQTLKSYLKRIKEDKALGISPKSLVGICLWTRMMTMQQFKSKYENMTTLFKHVTDLGQKTSKRKNVLEAYVHIPELTGMLPSPDFAKINEYFKLKKEGKNSSRFETISKEAKVEFRKITYYPRFYKAMDAISGTYQGRAVEVESLSSSGFATEAIGSFIRVLDNS